MTKKCFVAFLLLGVVLGSAMADAPVPLRRFALVAGSNDGGASLEKLRYAESDARSFASVLEELGGVKAQDLVLVASPSLQRFQDALQRVRQMVASPREMDERREFIFYYSGHSDDDGLILGQDKVPWTNIREDLNGIAADVKVAILDSCSSGSLTRAKGGVSRPAFLFDASADMTGHAFLTSASAEEAAQESDRIGSSFFTHFLISGLRGAADTAGDGMVTLNEAYTYAFQETLASTEKTQYGPQHPAYDISLSGSGDLVLTDLRSSSALLTVAPDVAGRLYVRDAQGNLAVELNKTGGDKVELGLEPGVYSVILDGKNARSSADIRVTSRQSATLAMSDLKPMAVDKATARGDGYATTPDAASAPTDANPAEALGKAIGEIVGSVVTSSAGKAAGDAVNAAIVAATSAAAKANQAGQSSQTAVTPPPPKPEPVAPAPESTPGTSFFHLSLLPDLNEGIFASRDDHILSLNLLAGNSGSIRGFELGGLANIESGDVVGFQAAGLANVALGSSSGFQAAGLANYMGGPARFFQSAGVLNVSGGLTGVQSAGVANVSLGETSGAQLAGVFNWSSGIARGAQLAGVFNWTGQDAGGAQLAGVFNGVGGSLKGAQLASVANFAAEVTGPQISILNIAGVITGAQIGLINIAREVTGTQVGLLNFSDRIDGIPFGLLSVEAQGRHDLDLWFEMDGSSYAAFSLGTRRLYTVLSVGWLPSMASVPWSFGLGVGGRSTFGNLFLDYDLSMVEARQGIVDLQSSAMGSLYPRVRLVAGLPLFGGLSVDVGASVRILVPYLSSTLSGADPNAASTVFQPSLIIGVHL